jgi:hypothetical protein
MPITAIPPGVVIKNITPAEKRALDELLSKERENSSISTALMVGIPSIIAGSAILAYVFKAEMQTWFKDQQDTLLEATKKLVAGAGEGVVDITLDTLNKVFRNNPKTPKVVEGSELSRCTRWAVDATDVLALVQAKGSDITKTETVAAALAIIGIAKEMKREGCSRPSAISQEQWNQA